MFRFLVFTLFVAGAYAQAPCRCAAFVTAEIGEVILYELPPLDVGDCGADRECERSCNDEFAVQTSGGDLNAISADGENTVGQHLCNGAGSAVDSQYVYSYFNLCDTTWQWGGERSLQPLCCDRQGNYFECP